MSQLGDITKDKEIEAIEKIEPKAIFFWKQYKYYTAQSNSIS